MLGDAVEAAHADVIQNGILGRKITEKSGLADFEDLDNIIDSGFLVATFAEQPDGSFDDLLAQSCFLAFAKAGYFRARGFLDLNKPSRLRRALEPLDIGRRDGGRSGSRVLATSHDSMFTWIDCTARRRARA